MGLTGRHDVPHLPDRPPLELVTLGTFALVHPDGRLALDASKQIALLTYLVSAPARTATREHLAGILWGDSPLHRALASLRTALHRLRATIGDTAPDDASTVVRFRVPIVADFQVFEAAIQAGDLARAIDSYTGPFIPEFSDAGTLGFEQWADVERVRLQDLFLRAGESATHLALDRGNAREALRLAARVKAMAPASESAHRLLLETLDAANRPMEALAEAAALRAWLDAEDRAPEPATAGLLRRIEHPSGNGTTPAEAPAVHLVSDLVAREREFATITRAWTAAARGAGTHLHVSAPAGHGKTRLLTEISKRLAMGNGALVQLKARMADRSLDYSVAADLVRQLGDLPGASGLPPASLAVLIALQPALSSRFTTVAPIPPGPDVALQRTQAIAELIVAVAESKPLAIVIDDLHWSDGPSTEIIAALAARLHGHRVLLLTASRPGEIDRRWPDRTLALPPLSLADITALLQGLGDWTQPDLPARLATVLLEATAGSPLLCLEALQLASERGDVTRQEVRWSCPDPERLLVRIAAAPAIIARIERLDVRALQVLLLLATAGKPIVTRDLASASGLPVQELESLLHGLEQQGYVIRSTSTWELGHDEIGSAIARHCGAEARAAAHAAIGRVLAAEALGPTSGVRRVAYHLVAGNARPELRALFRRWATAARAGGDRSPAASLAHDFLGPDRAPELRESLVRSLPVSLRFGWRPLAAVIVAAFVLLVAGVAATRGWNSPATPPPDAELVVATGEAMKEGISLHRVPLWLDRWRTNDSIRPTDGTLLGRWPTGIAPLGGLFPSPDGNRIAFERNMPDSGGIDIVVWSEEGGFTRVTTTPGDDVHPSWSPDGRKLVFSTARWSTREDEFSDLAILNLDSGSVRRLTNGRSRDIKPLWSPDGTRIAFRRSRPPPGVDQLCWVTADAGRLHCLAAEGELYPVAWDEQGARIVVGGTDLPGALDWWPDADSVRANPNLGASVMRFDPSLRFLLRGSMQGERGSRVSPAAVSGLARFIGPALTVEGNPQPGAVAFLLAPAHQASAALTLHPAATTIPVGVPLHFTALQGSGPRPGAPYPASVMSWRVRGGEATARVDSTTGTVLALGTGSFTLVASAGGWVANSIRLEAVPPAEELLRKESWADSALKAWVLSGEPPPRVVPALDGTPSFLNNGDRSFESGAFMRQGFSGSTGLAVEAVVSTPVQSYKWQRLSLELVSAPRVAATGGYFPEAGCHAKIPKGEGGDASIVWATGASHEELARPLDQHMASGKWLTLVIQLFPDGTCGFALDGKPVWRSTSRMDLGKPFHVGISGQSVEARMLVGPFTLWKGIRSGIDWTVLEPRPPRGMK